MHCGCGNTARLACMLTLVAAYFFVELIVGYAIHSISLVADAFHMLSDLMALVIGLIATRIAKWPRSSKNTFGWQRAEVMGGLINSVMLLTLCGTILLQAVQRFIETEVIERPRLMIYVGTGGLIVNILGLIVLGVHSHEGHEKTIEVTANDVFDSVTVEEPLRPERDVAFYEVNPTSNGALVPVRKENHQDTIGNHLPEDDVVHVNHTSSQLVPNVKPKKQKSYSKSLNMHAVFLHVLADFFGSIIVLVSALLLEFAPGDVRAEGSWKLYVDPAMSVLMVLIILGSTIPLAYKAALILLQSVPSEISLKHLKERLETIDGIHKVHDLHVWRLQSNCIIGTVHIRCASLPDYLNIARQVKELFHDFDIHCTTIQPEFEEYSEHETEREIDYQACVLDCGPNKQCQSDTCCPAPSNAETTTSSSKTSAALTDDTARVGVAELPGANGGRGTGGLCLVPIPEHSAGANDRSTCV